MPQFKLARVHIQASEGPQTSTMRLLTCANHTHILVVRTVVLAHFRVLAVLDEDLRPSACHLIQPDVARAKAKPAQNSV